MTTSAMMGTGGAASPDMKPQEEGEVYYQPGWAPFKTTAATADTSAKSGARRTGPPSTSPTEGRGEGGGYGEPSVVINTRAAREAAAVVGARNVGVFGNGVAAEGRGGGGKLVGGRRHTHIKDTGGGGTKWEGN